MTNLELFKAYRGAEILIPSEITVSYLFKKVCVFSSKARKEILHSLNFPKINVEIKVDLKRKYFPLSTKSKEYWKRINYFNK